MIREDRTRVMPAKAGSASDRPEFPRTGTRHPRVEAEFTFGHIQGRPEPQATYQPLKLLDPLIVLISWYDCHNRKCGETRAQHPSPRLSNCHQTSTLHRPRVPASVEPRVELPDPTSEPRPRATRPTIYPRTRRAPTSKTVDPDHPAKCR